MNKRDSKIAKIWLAQFEQDLSRLRNTETENLVDEIAKNMTCILLERKIQDIKEDLLVYESRKGFLPGKLIQYLLAFGWMFTGSMNAVYFSQQAIHHSLPWYDIPLCVFSILFGTWVLYKTIRNEPLFGI